MASSRSSRPRTGDRVERRRAGVSQYGNVHYDDQVQALIKWDDGTSSSLRLDREKIHVITRAPERARPAVDHDDSALAISA